MAINNWSTNEAQNTTLDGSDVSRGECPDASTSEFARKLMAHIKSLSDSVDDRFEDFVAENVEVDGITIVNNDNTLTVQDVAIGGDTTDLLTEKITEIEQSAASATQNATAAAGSATAASGSASAAASSASSAASAANTAASQAAAASNSASAAATSAGQAESAVNAIIAQVDAFEPISYSTIDALFA